MGEELDVLKTVVTKLDIKNLMASVENLNYNYIKKWVKELGIENIFNEVAGEGYIS